ncbi:MAG: protein kinase [Prosthecobacter sp.]|jgi:serine/threonine protein kinase/WD40 repeat protein|uniref:WD40 repeat domain-containing serine/threonine-protein kinase n=1 Tax=Prosthecobacter sp. TaxID=1965333 RepID=UPI0019DDD757|nr:WD40 repeat domain-containing serine/threonine-protein kinase [Prosthecobacter sp.]MBE2283092.1 protein kinase [Prosthecobacter sp.]
MSTQAATVASAICPTCGKPLPADAREQLCPACVAARMFESVFSDVAETDETSVGFGDNGTRCIGPYELRDRLGEGGFGEVFKAEQLRPVRRIVALKVLKPGMDTRQVIARFEAERQALALMDHPGIARVFDAGATEEGRPYFVMEYVPGQALSTFCEEHHPALRDRLLIFLQVCDAVHHAHQKGVIHRDLKPSNIIVVRGEQGGEPVVKLIDFGIARALSQTLTERTLLTRFHHVLGTPEYMSPEQAVSGGVDVDVRSDVYSLGVVLYELLTGTTPFRPTLGTPVSEAELLRRQREEDPPRPSTRVGTSEGPATSRVALVLRKNAARSLRGELDWIVLKALMKERDRRYASAGALAEDVRAYLEHRPVTARPPSTLYQLVKFTRRHRAMAAGIILTASSLIAAAFVSQRMAVKAETARAEAESAQQRMREVYSQADFRMAEELMASERASDAVAHLCRSLRTNPANTAAATRLIATLASVSTPQVLRAPLQHPTTVMAMRMTKDEQHIVTHCSDGHLWLWTTPFGNEPRLKLPFPYIEALDLSPDGQWLGGMATTNRLTVWRIADGQKQLHLDAALPGNDARWPALAFMADQVIAANASGHLAAWDLASGKQRWMVKTADWLQRAPGGLPSLRVTKIAVCPAGSGRIAAGLNDARIVLLDASGSLLALLNVVRDKLPNGITQLVWSPDGTQLALGTARGNVALWDVAKNTAIGRTPRHVREVHAIRFSPDGLRFATASYDNTARVFSTRSGEALSEFLLHGDDLYDAVFSPDGQTLATASRDMLVRLWAWNSDPSVSQPVPLAHTRSPNAIVFADQGRTLITSARDGLVRFWDLRRTLGPEAAVHRLRQSLIPAKAARARLFPAAGSQTTATGTSLRAAQHLHDQADKPWHQHAGGDPARLAVSGDDSTLVSWNGADLQAWQVKTGAALGPPIELPARIQTAALSHDGTLALLGHENGLLTLLQTASGKTLASRAGHRGRVNRVLLNPADTQAITAGDDATAQVWWLPIFKPAGPPMRHEAAIQHLVLSVDGKRLATGSLDNTARVWETATGAPVTAPLRHGDRAMEDTGILVALTPDARHLVTTGSHDLTARVWDIATGREQITPLYLNARGRSLAINGDGSWFAVGDDAGATRVGELATGRLLLHLPASGLIDAVAFHSDSNRLLGLRTGGPPILWNLPRLTAPLPEWFLRFAETWFGRRFNDQNVLESVPYAHFEQARAAARQPPPDTDKTIAAWAAWLTSDPAKNLLPP